MPYMRNLPTLQRLGECLFWAQLRLAGWWLLRPDLSSPPILDSYFSGAAEPLCGYQHLPTLP